MSTGRTLRQFPFEAEQVVEEVVAPLGWRLGPSDFQAAADSVSSTTFTKFILPSETLFVQLGAFRFGPNMVSGNRSAMGLAERMPAGNQCNRFFIVHGHALERFPNIPGRRDRIRLTIRSFRIHVDQSHLYGR